MADDKLGRLVVGKQYALEWFAGPVSFTGLYRLSRVHAGYAMFESADGGALWSPLDLVSELRPVADVSND